MNTLICISVDKKGKFTYQIFGRDGDASSAVTMPNSAIAWYLERDGKPVPFEIKFKGDSPFGPKKKVIRAPKGGITKAEQVSAAWSGKGMAYSVVVNSKLKHDPEIVIDPPAGGSIAYSSHLRRVAVGMPQTGPVLVPDWVSFIGPGEFSITFETSPFHSGETTIKSVGGGFTASRKLSGTAGDFPYTAKLGKQSINGTLQVQPIQIDHGSPS